MQSRIRDAEVDNRHVDTGREKGEGETNWENRIDIYTLPCVNRELVGSSCIAWGAQLSAL